jgi:hypothetical protein
MSTAAIIIVISVPPPKRQSASLADQVAESVRAALTALEAPDDEPPQRRDPAGPADRL